MYVPGREGAAATQWHAAVGACSPKQLTYLGGGGGGGAAMVLSCSWTSFSNGCEPSCGRIHSASKHAKRSETVTGKPQTRPTTGNVPDGGASMVRAPSAACLARGLRPAGYGEGKRTQGYRQCR